MREARHRGRRSWRAATQGPALLLVVIAIGQGVLAHRTALSPWKGGGFGMFSSNDGLPTRWLEIYVEEPDTSRRLDVPPWLERDADRLVTWPRAGALARFAERLRLEHDGVTPRATLRIEVWRADFSRSLDVTARRITEYRSEVGTFAATGGR